MTTPVVVFRAVKACPAEALTEANRCLVLGHDVEQQAHAPVLSVVVGSLHQLTSSTNASGITHDEEPTEHGDGLPGCWLVQLGASIALLWSCDGDVIDDAPIQFGDVAGFRECSSAPTGDTAPTNPKPIPPTSAARAARYPHVTDSIRRQVAHQVGGLLWKPSEESN